MNKKLKKILNPLLFPFIINAIYFIRGRSYRGKSAEEKHLTVLKNKPRYQPGVTKILSKELEYIDSASFYFIYKEIFKNEIYKFKTTSKKPYIIDAGANIGLGVIYFKQLYPEAEVTAFEPDLNVFNIMKRNINKFQLDNVHLISKGLWDSVGTLQFFAEGADAGRIVSGLDKKNLIGVQTDRLSPYLNRKVDFLKMDIEGAEYRVLKDCANILRNVQNIFVEFHSFVGKEQVLPEILQVLKTAGFRIFINTPGLVSKNPFMKINSYAGMDMQLNIYGYRL